MGRQRRKLVWATSETINSAVAAGGKFTQDLLAGLDVGGASKLGVTVMRTHMIVSTTWGAVVPPAAYYLGIKVADNIELSTPPALSTNSYLDWALFTREYARGSGATIDTPSTFTIDLRAKRKIEEMQQTWGLFVENTSGVAQTYDVFCRTLIALP